jgi:hypothetical protein
MPHSQLCLCKIGSWGPFPRLLTPKLTTFRRQPFWCESRERKITFEIKLFQILRIPAPSVNRHLNDFLPMNPIPVLLDNDVPGEKHRPHEHTTSRRGKKPWPLLIACQTLSLSTSQQKLQLRSGYVKFSAS